MCVSRGAKFVCLPENFAYMGKTSEESLKIKEPLSGAIMKRYR